MNKFTYSRNDFILDRFECFENIYVINVPSYDNEQIFWTIKLFVVFLDFGIVCRFLQIF